MKLAKASSILIILISSTLNAQNLIGSSEQEIRKYMTENMKDMSFQNLVNNNTFKYLKYTSTDDSQTLLFFLTEKLVCKSVRLVCARSLRTQKIRELNTLYNKTGDNQWQENKNGKKYMIELKDEDWSFNITIKLQD